MSPRTLIERLARRIASPARRTPSATATVAESDSHWLASQFASLNYLGRAEMAVIDRRFDGCGDQARLAFAKDIVAFFMERPEKCSLLGSSSYYLAQRRSIPLQLAVIAANYVIGNSRRVVGVAEQLAADWPAAFTAVLHARTVEDADGPEAEHRLLSAAAARYPSDLAVTFNLIENLIGSDRVAEANAAVSSIRHLIEPSLADEIAAATENQAALEAAVQAGERFPKGNADIYTDDVCRSYWAAYYESFVTRRSRQHGDRLILSDFVDWVRSVAHQVDVVLDFGTLCAHPLYEAALAAPSLTFVGTDRQAFIADLNRSAYNLPNLSFEHGDIFDVMGRVGRLPGRKALVHIRTTCTLYPRFVAELYSAAARLGFDHIYLCENAGLVRTRLQFTDFYSMPELALVTKHRLHVHNYREALSREGYAIRSFRRNRAPGLWRGEHPANYLGSQYEIHATRGPAA